MTRKTWFLSRKYSLDYIVPKYKADGQQIRQKLIIFKSNIFSVVVYGSSSFSLKCWPNCKLTTWKCFKKSRITDTIREISNEILFEISAYEENKIGFPETQNHPDHSQFTCIKRSFDILNQIRSAILNFLKHFQLVNPVYTHLEF